MPPSGGAQPGPRIAVCRQTGRHSDPTSRFQSDILAEYSCRRVSVPQTPRCCLPRKAMLSPDKQRSLRHRAQRDRIQGGTAPAHMRGRAAGNRIRSPAHRKNTPSVPKRLFPTAKGSATGLDSHREPCLRLAFSTSCGIACLPEKNAAGTPGHGGCRRRRREHCRFRTLTEAS